MKMSLQNIFVMITLLAMLGSVFAFSVASPVFAQTFNQQINYQGKLATPAGVAVSDGTYSMVFRLYNVASGGSNIWSETQTVTVNDGLFSVMLGTSTSLASVDFSQTLYLGININADGEMTPRKILGAVPAAFEAGNAQTLDNIATSSFLRSDEADTLAASSASTLLTLQQNGAGDLLSLTDGTNSLFQVNNAGQVSIGTTTDLIRRLTVAGADNAGSRFIDTTNNVIVDVRAEDFQGFIGTISSNDLRFVTDNTSRMTLTTGGALGIGTTTPTQRLTVSGGDALFEQNIRLAGALYDASGAAGTSGMILQTSGTSTRWVATSTLGIGSSVFTDGGDYTYLTSLTDGLVIGSTTAPVGSTNVALSVNQGKIDTTPNLVEMSETTITNAGDVYAAFGDYVLLRQSVNARIYDVSDVTAPVQVSTLPRGFTSLNAAVVVGDYVYAAVGNTDIGMGPRIYDISNVSDPVLVSQEAVTGNRDYDDIAVSGGYAYLIRGAGAGGDMDVFDVSDPTAPRQISTVSLDYPGQRIVVQGNYAYIGDDDLTVYDISDPFNPFLIDTASLSGGARDIVIRGKYLYATNGNTFEGLVTFDISDPTNITEVDNIDIDTGSAIAVVGEYVFVTGGFDGTQALHMFSVRDADSPVLVSSVSYDDTSQTGRIQVQGNYLHVVEQVFSNYDEYRIYDIGGIRSTTGEIGDLLTNKLRTDSFDADSVSVRTGLNVGRNALIGGALTVTGSASSTLLAGKTDPSFIVESGYVGIGTTTPTQKLSVSGNLRLTGALYDSNNSAGTNGMVLQTTATGTQWVATSTLGFGSSVTFGADNQVPFMNAAGDDFEYSSGFTYNGTNLNLAAGNGIAFGGTRYLHADATSDSIAFGEYAGATFGVGTTHNVALGFEAGRYASTSDADENNYIGRQAGYNNTGGTNNLFGAYAGYGNTGFFNNMLGQNAGAENTGAYNILIGGLAGYGNIGGNNVFVGELAGRDNEGDDGVFLGTSAGQNNTGSFSNMFGSYSGQNSTGSDNNLIGRFSGQNSTGSYNNILGNAAGQDGTGSYNNILGNAAGRNNTGSYSEFLGFETAGRMSASYTVAIGGQALRGGLGETYDGNAATTTNNTVIGYGAGRSALTGADNNILLGYQAANSLTTGANNIIIGYNVEAPSNSGSNQLNIGNLIFGTGIDGINTTLSSGNIGIGTTTPSQKLTVSGNLRLTGALYDANNSAGTNGMVLQTTAAGTQWVATSSLGISGATTFTALTDTPGSLSANRILFANSGASALVDSDLFTYNASTQTLNVGTVNSNTSSFVTFSSYGSVGYDESWPAMRLIGNGGSISIIDSGGMEVNNSSYVEIGAPNVYFNGDAQAQGVLQLAGALQDVTSSAGTSGMILQTTGTSTRWVSTSTLGFGSSVTFGADNQVPFMNAAGDDFEYSSGFTYNGTNLNLAASNGLAFGGTRYLHASSTANTISFGPNAGANNTGATVVSIGDSAGQNNTGDYNVFVGEAAGQNSSGNGNNFIGLAGTENTGGLNNFMGDFTGYNNTGGSNNFFGPNAGYDNIGSANNFLGESAGLSNNGSYNNFLGMSAGYRNNGDYNELIGFETGGFLQASATVAIGAGALRGGSAAIDGGAAPYQAINNVALGYRAGYNATTSASNNILLGYQAADSLTTGANNIIIGYDVEAPSNSGSNQLNIGNLIFGTGIDGTGTSLSSGNIGIGTTTPEGRLSIQNTGVSGAGVVGIDQYLGTANSVAAAVQYGNRSYFNAANTATTTIVGNMYRLADNTTFGNTVRGLEVQTNRGSNTQGENTALSGFARTFGVRGVTSGDAGGSFEPAGGFFETEGTTQGNAIRGYSDSITSATLLSLFQDTSAFTGTGLEMNFGNTTGSFSSSSSKYLDFQNGGSSVFTVSAYGTTTIGDGTTNNMAGLQIGFGGICVDNDGSCTASTTGRISAVSYETGNSDLAENYFSSQSLQTGEIVTMSGGLSVVRAEKDAALPILGVVSTKPGLTMGYDDSSLRAGETAYPIALTGRVPVQLSTENGPIKKGDQLMLSSLPGVAMKATGTGATIGIALEDFTESRMYSDTYLNQFGDDMVDPIYEPVVSNTDTRINDGCYYGGGNATGEEACVPLSATTSAGQINEVNDRLAQESVAEQIEALKGVRSQTKRVDGKSVKVGQVVMFVQNGHRWVDEDQLAQMNTLFATSSVAQLGENESETLFDRLVALADNFIDGVLNIAGLKADKVETSELCIDGVCVDSSQLRALLEASNNNDQTVEVIPVPTEDEEESTPEPEEDEEETQSPEPPVEENTDATSTEPVATSTPETPPETATSTPSTNESDAEPEESTPPEPPAEDEPIPEPNVEEEPLADEDSEPEPEPSVEAEPDPEPEESTPPESNESPL